MYCSNSSRTKKWKNNDQPGSTEHTHKHTYSIFSRYCLFARQYTVILLWSSPLLLTFEDYRNCLHPHFIVSGICQFDPMTSDKHSIKIDSVLLESEHICWKFTPHYRRTLCLAFKDSALLKKEKRIAYIYRTCWMSRENIFNINISLLTCIHFIYARMWMTEWFMVRMTGVTT